MRSIALVLLSVVGCASPDATTEGSPSGGGKADGTGSDPTLASTYAIELVNKTTIRDDRESAPSTMTLRARGRVKATVASDDSVALEIRLCDVTLPQVSGYQPELDASFVAGLAPIVLTGHIARPAPAMPDAGVPEVDAGDTPDAGVMLAMEPTTLHTDPGALVLGASLAHPLTDHLPADGGNARVRDQDADGNPGVSIHVPGYGSIFAALRVTLGMNVPLGEGTLHGTADIGLDEAIYGDDIWFYDAQSSIAETQAHVMVQATDNSVRMRAGYSTCNGVRTVFP